MDESHEIKDADLREFDQKMMDMYTGADGGVLYVYWKGLLNDVAVSDDEPAKEMIRMLKRLTTILKRLESTVKIIPG